VVFWVINRQRDSMETLKPLLPLYADATVHVVRNLYFGTPEQFELFNAAKPLHQELAKVKSKTVNCLIWPTGWQTT
jgi:hypothetical protein